MTRKFTFTESDLRRALRTAKATGSNRVEITKAGNIIIHLDDAAADDNTQNPWDEVMQHATN
jgi:hypothetical protein